MIIRASALGDAASLVGAETPQELMNNPFLIGLSVRRPFSTRGTSTLQFSKFQTQQTTPRHQQRRTTTENDNKSKKIFCHKKKRKKQDNNNQQ